MNAIELRRQVFPGVAVGLLAALGLLAAGCSSTTAPAPVASGSTTVASASTTVASAGARSTLSEVLGLVPATATDLTFMDNATVKARWGLSAVNGSTPVDDPGRVALDKKQLAGAAGSDLDRFGPQFGHGEPWDGTDVDWSATWSADGPPITIYRLRDGLDMDVVTNSLTKDGMTRSGTEDALRFVPAQMGAGTFGTAFLFGLTVIASKHLLIAGIAKSAVLPLPGSSSTTSAIAAALVGALPAVDYAQLTIGPASCLDAAAILGSSATSEAAKKLREQLAADSLKPVTASVVAVTDDSHGLVRTRYQDAATAKADLPGRRKLLAGDSISSRIPYATSLTATVATDGPDLVYDLALHRPAGQLRAMVGQRDTPWAFC